MNSTTKTTSSQSSFSKTEDSKEKKNEEPKNWCTILQVRKTTTLTTSSMALDFKIPKRQKLNG